MSDKIKVDNVINEAVQTEMRCKITELENSIRRLENVLKAVVVFNYGSNGISDNDFQRLWDVRDNFLREIKEELADDSE